LAPLVEASERKRKRRWIAALILLLLLLAGSGAVLLHKLGARDGSMVSATERVVGPVGVNDRRSSVTSAPGGPSVSPSGDPRPPVGPEGVLREPEPPGSVRLQLDTSEVMSLRPTPLQGQESEPLSPQPPDPGRGEPERPQLPVAGSGSTNSDAASGGDAGAARRDAPREAASAGGVPGERSGPGGAAGRSAGRSLPDTPVARILDPSAPDDCAPEAKEPLVLVFDGSVSMGLPLDMPDGIETELDRRIANGDEEARLEYRRWLASDQPKRLESAKAAVRTMLDEASPRLGIGAVAFTACTEIAAQPIVPFAQREDVAAFIAAVTPHRGGDTALARSTQTAFDMLRATGGRVIVLTDGAETCGGDICALAETAAKMTPKLTVDVVDLSGQAKAACLASATGGVMLTYTETRERMPLGRLLVRAANQCTMSDARLPGR
jgi:hypothetical protein